MSQRSSGGNLGLVRIVMDLLVMDGCCLDEYLHCTDPELKGERVNITFRWIRNHLSRCPLGTGVVCCLPTCARGSSVSTSAGCDGSGLVLWSLLWVLLAWGLLVFAAFILSGLWEQEHVVRRTRPFGGSWCQHCFCFLTVGFRKTRSLLGQCLRRRKWNFCVLCTLANNGQPSPIS